MHISDPRISLRPVAEADQPFLLQLYASVREEELKPTNWSATQKADFIAMQFAAQHHAYSRYPAAEFFLILVQQQAAGRIYLQHLTNTVHIIDISLLADARAQGVGTALLQSVCALAHSAGKAVQIHVEKFNPALRLYQRLGFLPLEDKGVYLLLSWNGT